MLDGMSMDQLRTFIAAADEGSFSAAGRKLRRAQSVVSHTLANLELQVGFALFDRTGRYPQLTEAGRALLEEARRAANGMDAFKARARTLAQGLEAELAVAVDVMFPIGEASHGQNAALEPGLASEPGRKGLVAGQGEDEAGHQASTVIRSGLAAAYSRA